MPDLNAFIDRWKASGASEKANFQSFIHELCEVLALPHPDPATDQTARNDYTFERTVTFDDGEDKTSTGFIDLYKRGCFVLEAKQGRPRPEKTDGEALGADAPQRKTAHPIHGTRAWNRMMGVARNQARRYARALPDDHGWPPFLLVVDVGHCFDLYADFSRQGKHYLPFPDPKNYRITLGDLREQALCERLKLVWTAPMTLDRSRQSARVTRRLAAQLAKLAASLEAAGHAPDAVAHFLMRCLFTMFAEDVGLLPGRSFTGLLRAYRSHLDLLPKALRSLWRTMDTGGFSPDLRDEVMQFNGSLFAEADALPVSEAQLDLLVEAAEADWEDVEPAIFGTLLERALDPRERHKLGAHFTPRAYVERLVMPTIVEPLREAWAAAQTAAAACEAEGDAGDARREIVTFHRRLCSLRVLDPACGSGNFLYVTLEHLKRLEGEVVEALRGYGGQQVLDMTGGYTVSPAQLLGLEINPRAAAIADVVLWIGYLQWHVRTTGDARRLDPPILQKIRNIRCRDAVLAYDAKTPRLDADGNPVTRWDGRTTRPHPATGRDVPDETARAPVYDYTNPRPAEWPAADFIVGNPPFIGTAKMREALGDGYTEALRRSYKGNVPNSADYVMFWWHKAAEKVRAGEAERFGFITTNSLRQTFNRRVLESHMSAKPPLSLAYAIPDHPWVDAELGADVRISMTVGQVGEKEGRLQRVTAEKKTDELGRNVMLDEYKDKILPNLTIGANVTSIVSLKANADISNRGFCLFGKGFIVSPGEAKNLGLGRLDRLEEHIRTFRNGRDITKRPRGVMVIDLFGLTAEETRERFPEVYQWVYERVKPERDQNKRRSRRENWWIFGEPNPKLRDVLSGLNRYIVTVEVSKHRFFLFLETEILPDDRLVVIASTDAYHLGVLSSRIHLIWALAIVGRVGVGNDPKYNTTRAFKPFPFPDATEAQQATIRVLAEALDAHRKDRLAAHETLTMTAMYNVLAKLRAGQPLSEKERRIHDQGLVGVLQALHDDLDAAVAAAYGWPAALPDAEILERLVVLNHERAREEAQGFVRYLRPAYQNPDGAQQTALPVEAAPARKAAEAVRHPWPKTLSARIQAVQRVLAAEAGPVAVAVLARRFHRARTGQVQSLLETLEALGHVRRTEAGLFVA